MHLGNMQQVGMKLSAEMTSLIRGTFNQLFTKYSGVDGSSCSGGGVSISLGQIELVGPSN